MGNPHPQTNRGPSERAKTQSSQSVGQNSNRPADDEEPAELKDVNSQATDGDATPTPEEQEIDRRLEAKVGLGLVVLLAAAFGFMLWQKWSHRPQETYAQTEPSTSTPPEQRKESLLEQPPLELEQPEPNSTPKQLDSFGEDEPIVQTKQEKVEHPLLNIQASPEPVIQEKQDEPVVSNIAQEDPFASSPSTTLKTEKSKPSKTADPFGDEWSSDPMPTQETDNPPILVLDENIPANNQPSSEREANPFEATESTPELVTEGSQDNPFELVEQKENTVNSLKEESHSESLEQLPAGPTLTPQPKQKPTENENKYSEAVPLLERIPDRKEERSRDAFGEFEVVPAGSSRASSTTNVAPGDFPEQNDPFTTSNGEPKELKFEFPETSAENDTVRTYRIAENDTYWKISQKAYHTSRYYRALASYNQNRISDPTKMPLGQEILLPPAKELELKYPELFPGQQTNKQTIVQTSGERAGFLTDKLGTPQYRVGENDTLSAIAQRHLGRASRWIQIYELNRKQIPDPNRLKIGTVLTLPTDASNVRVIGNGAGGTIR